MLRQPLPVTPPTATTPPQPLDDPRRALELTVLCHLRLSGEVATCGISDNQRCRDARSVLLTLGAALRRGGERADCLRQSAFIKLCV